jgi:hypothetical protein
VRLEQARSERAVRRRNHALLTASLSRAFAYALYLNNCYILAELRGALGRPPFAGAVGHDAERLISGAVPSILEALPDEPHGRGCQRSLGSERRRPTKLVLDRVSCSRLLNG